MAKRYIKDGDRVFSLGCHLIWDEKKESYIYDGMEDDLYFLGEIVNYDDNGRGYIGRDCEEDEDQQDEDMTEIQLQEDDRQEKRGER